MKKEELMLDNWVQIPNYYCQLKRILNSTVEIEIEYEGAKHRCPHIMGGLKPIEISHELLLKIGFEKDDNLTDFFNECDDKLDYKCYSACFCDKYNVEVCNADNVYTLNIYVSNINIGSGNFTYLHELQNLFQVITKEPLNIEL